MKKQMKKVISSGGGEEEINEEINQGKLKLDATCIPADIKYPTDLGLLNEAREQTEEIIDILYEELDDNENKKPRTYRNTARKEYLDVAKNDDHRKNKEDNL